MSDPSEACAADCGENTFKGPVCKDCRCCSGCAGAYEYFPPGSTGKVKCPTCKVKPRQACVTRTGTPFRHGNRYRGGIKFHYPRFARAVAHVEKKNPRPKCPGCKK